MTDKDIDKKLKKMEEQLDVITSSLASRTPDSSFSNQDPRFLSEAHRFSAAGRADEIDVRELFSILWQGKWWVIGITFLFAVAGVFYALSLPNLYKSEGIYAPAQKEGSGGGMAGQLGGLASLAGVSLGGGESNDIEQALVLLVSEPFLGRVIEKYNLKPLVVAAQGWNRVTGAIEWDREVYDPDSKAWLGEPRWNGIVGPTDYEAYLKFKSMLSVSKNVKTAMISISIQFYSPEIARDWVVLLKEELNVYFQQRDMTDAKKNIEYLEKKIGEMTVANMQSVFYGMVEAQTKTLMLAEVGDQYLIRTVVPPLIPGVRSGPTRAIICIFSVLLGGTLGVLLIVSRGIVVKMWGGK